MKPIHNYVLVALCRADMTESGIALAREKQELRGTVLATAEDVSTVSKGDVVRFSPAYVEVGDHEFIVDEREILAIESHEDTLYNSRGGTAPAVGPAA